MVDDGGNLDPTKGRQMKDQVSILEKKNIMVVKS